MASATLHRIGGIAAKERKVIISYKHASGRTGVTTRWLSQVQAFVNNHAAVGCTDFKFRLHANAPWHEVSPNG